MYRLIFKSFLLLSLLTLNVNAITFDVDPLSKDVLVKYNVPEKSPQEVIVSCEYSLDNGGTFNSAKVRKYRSLTAEVLLWNNPDQRDVIKSEMQSGIVNEYMAAGLERTLVWQVSNQLNQGDLNNIIVKIIIKDIDNNVLKVEEKNGCIDLREVIVLSDFSKVLQKDELAMDQREGPGWYWVKPSKVEKYGVLRCGKSPFRLNPLTLRPKLSGYYAIYAGLPYSIYGCISIRLSDELYDQVLDAGDPRECFWKIADLTGRNIVISQWDMGLDRTGLNYIRLVPISPEIYEETKKLDKYKRDKFVAGFTEPFSWAAYRNVTNNCQYAESLAAFKDAKLDWVDFQMGRLGMRPVYPTFLDEPILGASPRENGPGAALVKQTGSSLLCMSTDAFEATKIFADAFGVNFSANFGAGIAYSGALRSLWAENNSEYLVDEIWPQYKYKSVREEILSYFKEFIDKGAKRIAIDFCRYPNVIEKGDDKTATLFLKELRNLANQYSTSSQRIQILVKFPVPGVEGQGNNYNPQEWVEKELVDVIVPSGDCGNVNYFDPVPYIKMTKGTGIKCLPCVDLTSLDLPFPGQILQRIDQLYDAGCEGIYLYQVDQMIVGWMGDESSGARAIIARLGSSKAVKQMVEDFDRKNDQYGRDIYFHYPQEYKNRRVRVWIEGFSPENVETYIDNKQINTFDSNEKFYRIGNDGWENDYTKTSEPTVFSVKAKLKDKLFIKEFVVKRIY